jgi:hypothetical protein
LIQEERDDVPNRRHFGLATWNAHSPAQFQDKAAQLGKATLWLLDHRLPDGTWGGPDPQERFDTTLQVAQTLLMTGIAPDSDILEPALRFMAEQDLNLPITFWRAGTFINIPAFEETVLNDLKFGWSEPRAGLLGYAPPLFLLKCARFLRNPIGLPFTCEDALKRALSEWTPENCWAGRASLTSMGMALVHDLKFRNRESVLGRCREFLLRHAEALAAVGKAGFAGNLAEDCYVIFNVCEMPSVFAAEKEVAAIIERRVNTIWAEQTEGGFWSSDPPFKGSTAGGGLISPTALAIRALASYYSITDSAFVGAVGRNLMERCAIEAWSRRRLYPLTDEMASAAALTADVGRFDAAP